MLDIGRSSSTVRHDNASSAGHLTSTVEDQWDNHPQELFRYGNLNHLVKKNEIAQFDQNDVFFIFSHPARTRQLTDNTELVGWKFHISVHPDQLDFAFNIAAKVISKYSRSFKVVNADMAPTSCRYLREAQITIYTETQHEWGMTPEDAENMIREIDEKFREYDIEAAPKPESDVATISPYFSMRNDALHLAGWDTGTYADAETVKTNFNPSNHFNPFSHLLAPNIPTFDPLQHYQSLAHAGWSLGTEFISALSLLGFVREYTVFESMTIQERQDFIFKFCADPDNKIDTAFLKEAYRNNQHIALAVKQALSIALVQEYANNSMALSSEFHWHVVSSQFSTQYTVDDSFRQLMLTIEDYSKERDEAYQFQYSPKLPLNVIARMLADKAVENLSQSELIEVVTCGHFYYAQAALARLAFDDQYQEILHANDSIPAVQLVLAEFYSSQDPDKEKNYHLQAVLSADSNFIRPDIDLLMVHFAFDELITLHNSNHHFASSLLAIISMRDVFERPLNTINNFSNAPIDHQFARTCLEKIRHNPHYKDEATDLITLLDSFSRDKN